MALWLFRAFPSVAQLTPALATALQHQLAAAAVGHAHTLQLYDAAGRVIRTFALSADASRQPLSLEGLPAGVYSTRLLPDHSLVLPTQRLVVLP